MTDFALSAAERVQLEFLVAHTHDARQALRAYALLWLDDDDSVPEIAARLNVTRQSVYNWAISFQARASEAVPTRVADAARTGRPRTAYGVIDPLLDAVLDHDPRDFGYGSTIWTAPLLVQYLWDVHELSVCTNSVRLAIARLRVRWKRPRHRLALRPDTWRQAKGG